LFVDCSPRSGPCGIERKRAGHETQPSDRVLVSIVGLDVCHRQISIQWISRIAPPRTFATPSGNSAQHVAHCGGDSLPRVRRRRQTVHLQRRRRCAFQALPFVDADRVVLVGDWLPQVGGENLGVISAPKFTDYQRLDGRIFARSAIYASVRGAVARSGGELAAPERAAGLHVDSAAGPKDRSEDRAHARSLEGLGVCLDRDDQALLGDLSRATTLTLL